MSQQALNTQGWRDDSSHYHGHGEEFKADRSWKTIRPYHSAFDEVVKAWKCCKVGQDFYHSWMNRVIPEIIALKVSPDLGQYFLERNAFRDLCPQSKPENFLGIDPRSANPKYTPYTYTGRHIEPPPFHYWVPGYVPPRLRSALDLTSEKNNASREKPRAISSSRDESRGRPQDLSPPRRGRGSRSSRSPSSKPVPGRFENRQSRITTLPVTTKSMAVQATQANAKDNISRHSSAPKASYSLQGSSATKPSYSTLPTNISEGMLPPAMQKGTRTVTIGPIHYKPNNAFAGPNWQIIQGIQNDLMVRFEAELSCPKSTEHNGWISVGVVPMSTNQNDKEKIIEEAYDFVEYWKEKQMSDTRKEFNVKSAFRTWFRDKEAFKLKAQGQLRRQKSKEPGVPVVRPVSSPTLTTQRSADSARGYITKPAVLPATTTQISSRMLAPLPSPYPVTTIERPIDTQKTAPPMSATYPGIIQPEEILPSAPLSTALSQTPIYFLNMNQSSRPAASDFENIPLSTIELVEMDVDKMIDAEKQAQMEKSEHFYRALAGKGASKKRTFDVFEARSTSPEDNLAPLAAGQVIYDRATKRRYFLDEYEQLIERRLEEKVEKRIEERLEERVMARMEKRIELRLLTRLENEGRLNPRRLRAIEDIKPNESALEIEGVGGIQDRESIGNGAGK